MKARFGQRRDCVQGASVPEEAERLRTVTVPANRLEVRVLEGRASGGDLDDVVDVQLAGPSATMANLARVSVPEHHVGTGRVPEVVPVELPLALARTVRASVRGERLGALHATAGPASLRSTAGPVGEPSSGEGDDPTVGTDHHRLGGFGRCHPLRRRRSGFNRIPVHRKSFGFPARPSPVLSAGVSPTYGLSRSPYWGRICRSRSPSGSMVMLIAGTTSRRAGWSGRPRLRRRRPRRSAGPTRASYGSGSPTTWQWTTVGCS